jgi:hypothetical protein
MLPGSPAAVDHGCRCSRLANASYRVGATSTPSLDPDCELHRPHDVAGMVEDR